MVYLDTHVAVWLAAGKVKLLSSAAKSEIENNDLYISPMVYLEFEYLAEKGSVKENAGQLFSYLNTTFNVGICTYPFAAVCRESTLMSWTRDPFDRVITGHASARGAKLITADRKIRANYAGAVW